MADRLMIDLKRVKAINESYMKERWLRMNWRKNYRDKIAAKAKFRQDEIDEARQHWGGRTEIAEVLHNVEDDTANTSTDHQNGINQSADRINIVIPTESQNTRTDVVSTISSHQSRCKSARVPRSSGPELSISSKTPVRQQRSSARSIDQSQKQSVQTVECSVQNLDSSTSGLEMPLVIKPVDILREKVDSSRSSRRSSRTMTRRSKSAMPNMHRQKGEESFMLSGKQISLVDRESAWTHAVKVNQTTPSASQTFLNLRNRIDPEIKYDFPHLSSYKYGWRLSDTIKQYKPPTYGRSQQINSTFYRSNGAFTGNHKLYN